jgi:signal transduction histidine kinase
MHPSALAQWAHDIRNTLATVALHLESLERRPEPETVRVAARSNALLQKAAGMCSDLMRAAEELGAGVRRRKFDVMHTIGVIVDLIAPIVPEPTTLSVAARGPVYVLANEQDVFRILFNLIHNAVAVARATGEMRRVEVSLEQSGERVRIRIADDGPGLPEHVKTRLFRRGPSATGGTGYGLSIARELAERNGAILDLSDSTRGTQFTIELQGAGMKVARKLVETSAWAFRQVA